MPRNAGSAADPRRNRRGGTANHGITGICAPARAMHRGGVMEDNMTTLHASTDSRVLGWGALAVAAFAVAAFLAAAHPSNAVGHTVPGPHTAATQTRHG